MRSFIATILAASLAIPAPSFAASDLPALDLSALVSRLDALESSNARLAAELAALKSARQQAVAPALAPSRAPFSMMRRGLMAIGGPLIGLGGVPVLAYPGGGGSSAAAGGGVALGDTPTWTGAHTFSADVTLNGGTGALGFGAGETIVPADGALNITGTGIFSSYVAVGGSANQRISSGAAGEVDLFAGGVEVVKLRSAARLELIPPATFGVDIETTGSKVACAAAQRGSIFYQAGAGGVADVIFVCSKSSADVYAWRDLATPET